MEAPDKIWINPPIDLPKLNGIIDRDSIQYARTDAFINKACDAYCKVCGHYPRCKLTHICRQECDYFKDFQIYIKGSN